MKANHVWIVERIVDGEWLPIIDTATASERFARITMSAHQNFAHGREFRVAKYTSESSACGT